MSLSKHKAAEALATPMPFASVLWDNLLNTVSQGDGERDWAALAKVAVRRKGTRLIGCQLTAAAETDLA